MTTSPTTRRPPNRRTTLPTSPPAVEWPARSVEAFGLAAFVVAFFLVPDGATPWVLVANLVAFYAVFIRAIAVPDRILPRLPSHLTIEVLFLAYGYLIFYYPYQLFVIGATDLRVSKFVANSFVDGSNRAITLATIGMLAFTLGYRIVGKGRGAAPEPSTPTPTATNYAAALATASSGVLLTLSTVYLLAGFRSAGEGRYTGTTTNAVGVEGFATIILVLCMIVSVLWIHALANDLRRSPLLVVGLVVAVAWALRLLILGDRNSFLLVALVLVGGYVTFVRRVSPVVITAAFGVWLVVYYAIEVLRSTPGWYRPENVSRVLEAGRLGESTTGDGSFNVTTMSVRATVEVVPFSQDYLYGALKLIQMSSALPFSNRLFLPYLDPEYTNSAALLTDVMLGGRSTWGTGTNVVSDSFIDFGVAGVVVVLLGLGVAAGFVRNYVARAPHDAHRVVVYLLTLALFAELPRYAIEVPVRMMAWALMFCAVVGFVAGRARTDASPERRRTPAGGSRM